MVYPVQPARADSSKTLQMPAQPIVPNNPISNPAPAVMTQEEWQRQFQQQAPQGQMAVNIVPGQIMTKGAPSEGVIPPSRTLAYPQRSNVYQPHQLN
jgi:hypothetical protein